MSSWRRYNPICADDGSYFSVSAGNGRGGVGPKFTHLSSQKADCWIDNGGFEENEEDPHQGGGRSAGVWFFFKAVVKSVLIFGAEKWVVTPRIGRVLGGDSRTRWRGV